MSQNIESPENNGCLFLANRMGWSTVALLGMLADDVNSFKLASRDGPGWAGELTNHVGDTVHGFGAMIVGFATWKALESSGVDPRTARTIGLITIACAFAFVVWAELTGFGNKTDLLDTPAIGIGLIGGASVLESSYRSAREALKK